nr:hypothetical protein [Simkaniaceae bacterium]
QKIRIPDAFFVDFKRHAVISQPFRGDGTFRGDKNETPIHFTKTFSIPPELDMDGKGAICEWIALINGGGFSGGHYVVNLKASNDNYYNYNDSSAGMISTQEFIAAGQQCYGGFVRVIKRGDSQPTEEQQKLQEIFEKLQNDEIKLEKGFKKSVRQGFQGLVLKELRDKTPEIKPIQLSAEYLKKMIVKQVGDKRPEIEPIQETMALKIVRAKIHQTKLEKGFKQHFRQAFKKVVLKELQSTRSQEPNQALRA